MSESESAEAIAADDATKMPARCGSPAFPPARPLAPTASSASCRRRSRCRRDRRCPAASTTTGARNGTAGRNQLFTPSRHTARRTCVPHPAVGRVTKELSQYPSISCCCQPAGGGRAARMLARAATKALHVRTRVRSRSMFHALAKMSTQTRATCSKWPRSSVWRCKSTCVSPWKSLCGVTKQHACAAGRQGVPLRCLLDPEVIGDKTGAVPDLDALSRVLCI